MFSHLSRALLLLLVATSGALPVPRTLNPGIEIRSVARFDDAMRITQDPRDRRLYVMDNRARIGHLDPGAGEITIIYTAADHGVTGVIWGFAIGPDGTMYISNKHNTASITKGMLFPSGERT